MNDTSKTKYKRYDEAFKRQAVEHWLVSGKSGRQIAGELGINEQSLKVWKQKFKQLPVGQVAPTLDALQAENRRLQRELTLAATILAQLPRTKKLRYEVALADHALANCLTRLGRHEQALPHSERAERFLRILAAGNPDDYLEYAAAAANTYSINLAQTGDLQRSHDLARMAS